MAAIVSFPPVSYEQQIEATPFSSCSCKDSTKITSAVAEKKTADRSFELKMEIALQTVEYLDKERDYVPWEAAGSELGYVGTMLQRHPLYGGFKVCTYYVSNSRSMILSPFL